MRVIPVLALAAWLAGAAWTAAPAFAQDADDAAEGEGAAEQAACSDCHDVDPAALAGSVHESLSCTDCHVAAAQESHPEGMVQVDCASCHSEAMDDLKLDQPFAAYEASVHARAVREGKPAATCASCHGTHDVRPANDPASMVNHLKVAETCGQCHGEIAKAFALSVHGKAAASGVREAPVCTDCHGEHRILAPSDPGSPVFATNVPKMTCGRCHGDLKISEKYGMATGVVASFEDSFHGLAGQAGSRTVANCASCHGVHNILPSADPGSTVNKANLAKTCGTCHPGAGTHFAIGPVHVLATDEASSPAVYWVRLVYLWLIWLVIGGMVLHNALDLRRKALSPIRPPVVPVAQRRPRMSRGFRIAHAATMVSFLVLVYTGFALKFPASWWARPLLTWEESVALRGFLHRGAALVMVAAFAGHFLHLALSRQARACIKGMLPNRHDLRELRERLAWYLGRRAEMPRSPRLSYIEKAEYLALLWGTAVMAFTGFLLWFENLTLEFLPKWAIDVSTAIHFYEAVLASLAILVWHFYFVIFDPLVYPMDTAWLTGREVPGRTLERE